MAIEKQILQKIYAKIDIDEDSMCFKYLGGTNGQGYGRIYARGKMHGVHRLMHEIFHGQVPEDREVHHVCDVRNCCNPAHLEATTHQRNAALTRAYKTLRLQRLQLFSDAYPQLEIVGSMIIASTQLAELWSCRSNNIPGYLNTLSFLYGEQFQWEMIERRRGPKPAIFHIRMEHALIEQDASAPDCSHPSVDVVSQMPVLAITV